MIFEPLRRSLMRWLRPGATSVSPKMLTHPLFEETGADLVAAMQRAGMLPKPATDRESAMDAVGDAILKQLRAAGMIPADAEVRVHHGALPGTPGPRPGIRPPPDPAAEGWTWAAWKRELDAGAMPGWAVCRFANRIGADQAAFVFGVVRGSFGIWRQPFNVCAAGADPTEHILTCLTHLPSGLGVGIFSTREIAAEAAELAERVCPGWATIDPDDRASWNEVHTRTGAAWSGIGVRYADDAHCHDQAGGTYGIYTRSPESVMAGRPEKLS